MKKTNNINYRDYRDDDLDQLIEFMQNSYAMNGIGFSWQIDRINFTRSVSRTMNDLSLDDWASQILIVEEGENIVAVVNTEGENCGEAFFQLIKDNYDSEIITKMFDFTEKNLRKTKDGKTFVALRLKSELKQFIDEAVKRGFKKDWHEPIAAIQLTQDFMDKTDRLNYTLPEGFSIKAGEEVSPKEKAEVHSKAFGYYKDLALVKKAATGFYLMTIQPSYVANLDLCVCNEEGLPVAFATFWFDTINKVATIEPVGTHENFRHLGLAKAAIYEGIKRCEKLGASHIYVGSDQAFYKKIGFKVIDQLDVYIKEF